MIINYGRKASICVSETHQNVLPEVQWVRCITRNSRQNSRVSIVEIAMKQEKKARKSPPAGGTANIQQVRAAALSQKSSGVRDQKMEF